MLEEPRDLDETVISTDDVVVPTNLVILQAGADPNVTDFVGPIETPPIVECPDEGEMDLT